MSQAKKRADAPTPPPPLKLAMDGGMVDADALLAGVGDAIETVRGVLQGGIDRVQNRQRDFVEDLQTVKMEADGSLKATKQMRRELMSEVVLLKRAVEGLRVELDQVRRAQYRK